MIVVDASALVAILAGEPEADAFLAKLLETPSVISPIGFWEAAVAARRGSAQTAMTACWP